jgi:hypothetical protein
MAGGFESVWVVHCGWAGTWSHSARAFAAPLHGVVPAGSAGGAAAAGLAGSSGGVAAGKGAGTGACCTKGAACGSATLVCRAAPTACTKVQVMPANADTHTLAVSQASRLRPGVCRAGAASSSRVTAPGGTGAATGGCAVVKTAAGALRKAIGLRAGGGTERGASVSLIAGGVPGLAACARGGGRGRAHRSCWSTCASSNFSSSNALRAGVAVGAGAGGVGRFSSMFRLSGARRRPGPSGPGRPGVGVPIRCRPQAGCTGAHGCARPRWHVAPRPWQSAPARR